MDDDALGLVVGWAFMAVAFSVVSVAALAVGAVALVGYGIYLAGREIYRALSNDSHANELRRLQQTRDQSAQEILSIHQAATRRMTEIANEDVIEGRARDIERR